MQPVIQIKVEPRTISGKGGVRRMRASGQLPAVLYGPQNPPIMVALDRLTFSRFLKRHSGESPIIDIQYDAQGKTSSRKVAIKEIQTDPVTDEPLHVDFYEFAQGKPIVLPISVKLVGECIGVRDQGGILQFIGREVNVKALPVDFPSHLNVDISHLEIGDTLMAKEVLAEYPKLEAWQDEGKVIVSVIAKKKVEEEKPVEEDEETSEEGTEDKDGSEDKKEKSSDKKEKSSGK